MKKNTDQSSLFETDHEKQRRYDQDERKRLWDETLARVDSPTRVSIVRGFLTLHYNIDDPIEVMKRKLQSLGGKSLYECCFEHWNVIQGWMKEINLYKENKYEYIKEYKK